ncbi:HutD family protein [Curvibacter sp. CHRR-16]|uniref:HutD/Ves family protein n=1 Tax=Curvibacter sp. CHRR-16 TaxID=2835872 RepID=UPI001BD95858|nr:HutD family protein [Curvibacter sp. CHRR-16]
MERVTALASIAPTPWRNGGGTTRELLAWPSSADWQLRLSVADIASDGDFSAYPGVQRWFAVLSGAGVVLHWPAQASQPAHTETATPTSGVLQFDGATPPYGQLVDGPVQDFNLMSRSAHADLLPVQAGQAWQAPASAPNTMLCGLFICQDGVLQTGDAQHPSHKLPAMSLYHRIVHTPSHGTAAQALAPWVFEPTPMPQQHGSTGHSSPLLGWWFYFQPATQPL